LAQHDVKPGVLGYLANCVFATAGPIRLLCTRSALGTPPSALQIRILIKRLLIGFLRFGILVVPSEVANCT
jgi:hypothetical protein